ncbi:MAG: hypothetical protein AB7F50_07185 [Fimbriimonadaceae bacterium]
MSHSEDIRDGELRQVLRQLDEEGDGHVARAVSDVTGADPSRVARAVARVRLATRVRMMIVAAVVVGASLGTVAALKTRNDYPKEERTSALVPARLR